MTDNIIEKLTDREHVLKRPQMYVGSMTETEVEDYFQNAEGKFDYTKIKYVPALQKIIFEILDNSIDESIRTQFQFANKISVNMTDDTVEIIDNGRGLPLQLEKTTNEPMAVIAFTHAKSGSNFKDEGRETIGTNGVGSFCTNVFSKSFKVETADSKNKLNMTCLDNMSKISHSISPSTTKGTKITFKPDLEKFGLTKMDEVYKNLIRQRLNLLSISFPQIYFSFNGKKTGFATNYNFVSQFSEHFVVLEKDNYFIAVTPNMRDDFKFFTYVNGLYLKSGGNHIEVIQKDIVNGLREKIQKSYKNIQPGDIKNKLQLIVFFKNFNNMKFDSQTKENLTNSTDEIRKHMIDLKPEEMINFIDRIYKRKEIIDPITDYYKIREEMKKRDEARKTLSNTTRIRSDKYLAPTKGNKKYLVLGEGASAVSGLMAALGREGFGFFELKGKSLNVFDVDIKKTLDNEEFKTISQILGLKLDNISEMSYENILIASDADLDGSLIRGLLVTFFMKYCKNLLKEGKIKFLKTPMIVGYKSNKIVKYFFNFQEYSDYKGEKLEMKYVKGLGTWGKDELKIIFEKDGLDNFIETFEYTEESELIVKNWMSKLTSDYRKSMIRGHEFNIEKL